MRETPSSSGEGSKDAMDFFILQLGDPTAVWMWHDMAVV